MKGLAENFTPTLLGSSSYLQYRAICELHFHSAFYYLQNLCALIMRRGCHWWSYKVVVGGATAGALRASTVAET